MKKLLALTAVLGATTAVVSACGTDTLAQLDNVSVGKLTDFSCATRTYQTAKAETAASADDITTVYQTVVKMNYNWSAKEAGDFMFYAIVTDVKGAKLATKTVEIEGAEKGAQTAVEFAKTYTESAFFACSTLMQQATQPYAAISGLTGFVKNEKTGIFERKADVNYSIDLSGLDANTDAGKEAIEAKQAEIRKFFTASKAQFAPQK